MPHKIRVLLVSWTLGNGGAERFTANLLQGLDRSRFQPELCLLGEKISYPVPPDVPVHKLGHTGGAWSMVRIIRGLRAYLKESRPDVVLSNIATTNTVTGEALRGIQEGPRWVARIGGDPVAEFQGLTRWIIHRWQSRVYPRAQAIVCNSNRTRESFQKYFSAFREKVKTIYNPTDFDAVERLSQEPLGHPVNPAVPLIISVGRLSPEKRYDVILEAFARIAGETKAELWICGDGPLENSLKDQANRYSLGQRIRFLGFTKNPFPFVRHARVFVLASDYESLPNALMESQGLGVPAVITQYQNGPEEILVPGETGFQVGRGDAAGLADGLSRLLQASPEDYQRMSQRARQHARDKFDVGILLPQWESLLEKVAEFQ